MTALTSALQQLLADLLALSGQLQHACWTALDPPLGDGSLGRLVRDVDRHAEAVAGRLRALDAVPDARPETVAATTTLPPFPRGSQRAQLLEPIIRERLAATARTARVALADAADDPVTSELLRSIEVGLSASQARDGEESR